MGFTLDDLRATGLLSDANIVAVAWAEAEHKPADGTLTNHV